MLHAIVAAAALALTGPQVGSPAPDFHLTTLEGKHLTLADFRGKTLVLNDWATWCPPCREETSSASAVPNNRAGSGEGAFPCVYSSEPANRKTTSPLPRSF